MNSADLEEIGRLVAEQGSAFAGWKSEQGKRLLELEKKLGRSALEGAAETADVPVTTFRDTKSHKAVPVLAPSQKLARLETRSGEPSISMGRFLRGIALGGAADDATELADERKALSINVDPAGGYTVGGVLAREWIDALRAEMVLTRAGARTVPMDSKTLTLAKVTADPTISWHNESAAVSDSDPTFGAVTLNARTVVGLVRLSLELSQDSANIEEILQRSLVSATAHAIDSAGLSGVAGNAAAPSGIFELTGRNRVTSVGAPTTWDWVVDGLYELLLDDVPADRIGALIAHPAVWKKMRKLKTGITSDNSSLVPPAEVAALPKLWTTAAPLDGSSADAVLGDWSNLLLGVRQDVQVRVLTEAFMGSNLQIAVLVYARCDFAATRAQSFVTMEGITVS